jgi:hypothetical protein
MWSAGPGDDQARFLADLRALRGGAAIGYDELAARAHYPSDILKEAENGPLLPGLPVLSAYVRACEGDVLDWEERWRRLASEVPEDPDLPVRPAGASPAAVAGARAGVGVTPPEVHDPERIRAALRGGHRSSGQKNGRRTLDRGASAPTRGPEFSDLRTSGWGADSEVSRDAGANLGTGAGEGWNGSPSWDADADQTIMMPNGNHSVKDGDHRPFGAAAVEMPDTAERADTGDQFRWLPDTDRPSPSADTEFEWPADADTARADAARADAARAAPSLDVGAPPAEPAADEWVPWRRSGAANPLERTDFWTTPVTAAPDLQLPTTPPRWVEQQPSTGASRPAPAQTSSVPAGSATAQTASTGPAHHEKDRFFPVRLLVIIVIAALIGSALVLLLK